MLEIPAAALAWCYSITESYATAIALFALVIAAATTPLTMSYANAIAKRRDLVPRMRQLQDQYSDDRPRLISELQAFYERSTPTTAAWLAPLAVQAAIFLVVLRVLNGLIYRPSGAAEPVAARVWLSFGQTDQAANPGFVPRHLPIDSELYQSLFAQRDMVSFTLDLSRSAAGALADSMFAGLPYVVLVAALAGLYVAQRRIVDVDDVLPGRVPGLRDVVRWSPMIFAAAALFLMAGIVVYYLVQTMARLGQLTILARLRQ
ncbi:MAG: YidC/Oxa1 family membrane protein insertase [Actinomycetota bacterium]